MGPMYCLLTAEGFIIVNVNLPAIDVSILF
jgi:hypothetical protein